MANTTNYNWETPDDTDLVKDGAAAIRTLGNSIDTTTKNLNPETTTGDIAYRSATANTNTRLAIGSTGQVLTVAAGVPSWATPSDQTPLTTKGDVFTFSTVDARLGVGANGTVLTADSSETTGLKWAAPGAASFVGCKVKMTADLAVANNTDVTVTFGAEEFDTDGFHSTSSNTSRITIPAGKGGKYLFTAQFFMIIGDSASFIIYTYKNGSLIGRAQVRPGSTGNTSATLSDIYSLVATDYIEYIVFQNSGSSQDLQATNSTALVTYAAAQYLGA